MILKVTSKNGNESSKEKIERLLLLIFRYHDVRKIYICNGIIETITSVNRNINFIYLMHKRSTIDIKMKFKIVWFDQFYKFIRIRILREINVKSIVLRVTI